MNLANKITVFRLFLVPAFMLFAALPFTLNNQYYQMDTTLSIYIATAIFILAAATDKLDGYIARKYKQITKLGIFLDPLADKLLITAALICLLQSHRVDVWAAFLIIGRELVITVFRLAAVRKGIVLPADKTGKIKMVIQVTAIVLTLLYSIPSSLVSTIRFDKIAIFLAVLITIYSGVHYLVTNWSIFIDRKISA